MAEITFHACPPRCDAGGTEFDGGHIFDLDRDFIHCGACGADYTIAAGSFHDTRQLLNETCAKCNVSGSLTSGGGSLFCRCGLSAMDWTLMRPTPPRNETLITCTGCDYDEAEGGLIDQCEGCKRKNAALGSLMVSGEWHDVYVTDDGAIRDGCDAGCNSKVYVRGRVA